MSSDLQKSRFRVETSYLAEPKERFAYYVKLCAAISSEGIFCGE